MIDFEITRVDEPALTVQIKYSKEGCPDYYVRSYVGQPFNEQSILAQAQSQNNVLQATRYWSNIPESALTLETTAGQIKEVVTDAKPDYDSATQKLEKVVTEEETQIRETWSIVDLTVDELTDAIRQKRNLLLYQTDVYALSDRSMSSEMTAYRQSLRDLTAQESFPNDVVWPVKPVD